MKKYVKPELFYEQFTLTQTIADCMWELTGVSEYVCTAQGDEKYGLGGRVLFTEDRRCTDYEYCYMNSISTYRTLRS